MELQQKVEKFIEPLLDGVSNVVVGVSGGADSVCLLYLLSKSLPQRGIGLSVVHVNHGIRVEAAEDQAYVRALCEKWGIPFFSYEEDVPKLAKEQGIGEEEAGRNLRYQCYAKEAKKYEGTVVALAHHMHDQVETVLFRMCRGTGVDGLSGIRAKMQRNDGLTIIRPLLCVTRQEIEDFLGAEGILYQEDQSNQDTTYMRNQIRHNVIPELEQVNDKVVEHICKLAELADKQNRFIQSHVDEFYKEKVSLDRMIFGQPTGYLKVNADWLAAQDDVIIEGILRKMIYDRATGLKDISEKHISLLKELLLKPHQESVQLPYELEGFICYENLLIGKTNIEDKNCENLVNFYTGNVPKSFKNGLKSKKIYTQLVDYAKINDALILRYPRQGDMIGIDSEGHQKSLARFFIDEKIPKHMRDQIPLVCDGDNIVWVVGYRLNPAYYVTESTTKVVRMELDLEVE